jgi:hypothetical protein
VSNPASPARSRTSGARRFAQNDDGVWKSAQLLARARTRAQSYYRSKTGHLAGHSGSVTFIQRFNSGLALSPHFHLVALDGVFVGSAPIPMRKWVEHDKPRHGHHEGFDLDADVAIGADYRQGLEHLLRYGARSAIAGARLRFTMDGRVALELKRRYHDGTSRLLFEPTTFIERLAALVPRPHKNLTVYSGVRPTEAVGGHDEPQGGARDPRESGSAH